MRKNRKFYFHLVISLLLIASVLLAAGCGADLPGQDYPGEGGLSSSDASASAGQQTSPSGPAATVPTETEESKPETQPNPATTAPAGDDSNSGTPNAASDFVYEVADDHVRIDGYVGSSPTMIIPDEIEGKPVTHLAELAFARCEVTKAVVPGTITNWYYAFNMNTHIIEVVLMEGITSVDSGVFNDCSSLRKVTLPSTLVSIKQGAFGGCTNLEAISFPEGLKSIETYGFTSCVSLTSIFIPASVEYISPELTFAHCYGLTAIDVAEENTHYVSVDGILFDKNMTTIYAYPSSHSGDTYSVPDTVKTLAPGAFFYPQFLKELYLPDGITEFPVDIICTYDREMLLILPDSVVTITDDLRIANERLKLGGKPGSYADTFAKTHGITYQIVE